MSAGGEEKGHSTGAHPEAALAAINGIIASVQKSRTMCRLVYTSSIAGVLHTGDTAEFERRPLIHDWRYPGENYTDEDYKKNVDGNGCKCSRSLCVFFRSSKQRLHSPPH